MPIGGIPTGWDIRVCYYSNYLSSLEKFLESEARILGERYDAEVQEAIESKERINCGDYTLPAQLGEEELGALDYFFEEGLRALEDIFPNILRRSFFVTIYSLIEMQLNEICRKQERTKGLPVPLEKVKKPPDQSVRRAKEYLVGVAKIRFPESSEWDCSAPLELDNYDSSSRISPRKGKHHVKASNVYTRVQGPGGTGRVDRSQGQSRNLS